MENTLDKIRDFADKAHGNQMRKYTPERYMVHPIRVMETCRDYDASVPMLAAALLHDVLEDTALKNSEMLAFLQTIMNDDDARDTVILVEELTDVYTKSAYPQWNRKQRKIKENERIRQTTPEAQTIKYADIIDNTSEITVHDPAFAPRFLKECLEILEIADKGNTELYQIALTAVKDRLRNLKKKRSN